MRYMDPKRLWREVEETAHPQKRLEKLREVKERAVRAVTALKVEADKRERTLAALALHPGTRTVVRPKVRKLRILAVVLVALDVPLQLLLTRAALPQVEFWIVAAGSAALALGLAAIIHLVAYGYLYDEDRPARSLRLVRWLAGVSLAAVALGGAVFLFARQASPEVVPHIMTLTAVSLWTMAEALPLAAGFFSAWAHMLAHPEMEEEALRSIRAELPRYERLLEQLGAEEERLEGAEASSAAERLRVPAVRRDAATLGLVLLMAGALFQPLEGQPTPERRCALMTDRTLSVDPVHHKEAQRVLWDALPALVHDLGCRELVAGHFADEGPWAPRTRLAVPEPPEERDCRTVTPEELEGTQRLLAGFAGFRHHHEERARAACREEAAAAREAHARARQAFLASVRSHAFVPLLTRPTHTDIAGVVESLLGAGVGVSLLLTDGIDTVNRALPAIGEGKHVVLILVPAAEPYGGRRAVRDAAARWEEAGAATVPYTAFVVPSGWARLAARDEER